MYTVVRSRRSLPSSVPRRTGALPKGGADCAAFHLISFAVKYARYEFPENEFPRRPLSTVLLPAVCSPPKIREIAHSVCSGGISRITRLFCALPPASRTFRACALSRLQRCGGYSYHLPVLSAIPPPPGITPGGRWARRPSGGHSSRGSRGRRSLGTPNRRRFEKGLASLGSH